MNKLIEAVEKLLPLLEDTFDRSFNEEEFGVDTWKSDELEEAIKKVTEALEETKRGTR